MRSSIHRYFVSTGLALLASLQVSCSLHQSKGRKFLEKQAFQFAAAANLQGCGRETLTSDWLLLASTPDAEIFGREDRDFAMIVRVHVDRDVDGDVDGNVDGDADRDDAGADGKFHCRYQFESDAQMSERTESAIDLTHAEMAQGLGGLAFPTPNP